jgi:hypothetical protein
MFTRYVKRAANGQCKIIFLGLGKRYTFIN